MVKKTKDSDDSGNNDKQKQKACEEVAKHLRFNVVTKAAQIKGKKVDYFPGSKAVDCLMESKWTKQPSFSDSDTVFFSSRSVAGDFCTQLLRQRLFIRLKKVDVIPRTTVGESQPEEQEGVRKRTNVTDSPSAKKGEGNDSDGSKKRKKKFRLELHEQQVFVDSPDEIYNWEYDPPSRTTYIIGFSIVVGAIALTLQPLWPESTRASVWYGSMGLLGVMGFLVALIIARWFVFGLVQVFTFGKLHFWVLPNLDNEKCGFLESFKPFFSLEWKKPKPKKEKKATQAVENETENTVDTS